MVKWPVFELANTGVIIWGQMSHLGLQQCEAALSPSPGNRYYSRGLAQLSGTGSRRVPVPAKGGKNAQADLKSACMEPGICNPKSSPPRESCGSVDPPLTPDGLEIRQILSPLIGAALKQGSQNL